MHNLTIEITKDQLIAAGDTYNARQALKEAGWQAQKIGYSWSWIKPIAGVSSVKSEIDRLSQCIGEMMAPVLRNHKDDAARGGFAPRPLDYAWELTLIVQGREAYYLASEGKLIPARMEAGRLIPQEVQYA